MPSGKAGFAIGVLVSATCLFAQWPPTKTPGLPRGADGKPDFAAKTPLAASGRPDLSGLWSLTTEAYWDDIGTDLKPAGLPLLPWAAALYKQRNDNLGKDNPIARCMPAGVPTIDVIPTPFKIIQTLSVVTILY